MQTFQPSVFARDDTFFGVCEALGEDLRFNPNLLRVAFALLLFWSPAAAIGGYVGAGLLVAITRWVVPNPRIPMAVETLETGPRNDDEPELALAA
ncbi:MAG: PspC domain-containing protein [Sphingosinicella sp.]